MAHSPVLPIGHSTLNNTQLVFNFPSIDEVGRSKHIKEVFHRWLSAGLQSGKFYPALMFRSRVAVYAEWMQHWISSRVVLVALISLCQSNGLHLLVFSY